MFIEYLSSVNCASVVGVNNNGSNAIDIRNTVECVTFSLEFLLDVFLIRFVFYRLLLRLNCVINNINNLI